MQRAHDNGEFFTPPSLVQTIVNVIEPDHGIVLDPACGSGGMFVQSSHFIEQRGQDTGAARSPSTARRRTATTIRLAKMNLAVHGLEGNIARGHHLLPGRAQPVRQVRLRHGQSARSTWTWWTPSKVKDDRRLPFGLPGVNKDEEGLQRQLPLDLLLLELPEREGPRRLRHVLAGLQRRARRGGGAPQDRRDRRRGRDDLHPLQLLLHPHRALRAVVLRPGQARRAPGQGADARRAQRLPQGHAQDLRLLPRAAREPHRHRLALPRPAGALPRPGEGTTSNRRAPRLRGCRRLYDPSTRHSRPCASNFEALGASLSKLKTLAKEKTQPFMDELGELGDAAKAYVADRDSLLKALAAFVAKHEAALPTTNKAQHATRQAFDPAAEKLKGLVKQVDLLYKLCARAGQLAAELSADDAVAMHLDRQAASKRVKQLDEERKAAVEQLKQAAYFHRQVAWLQDRFPKAELEAVPGLCKTRDAEGDQEPPTGASPPAATSASLRKRRTRTSTSSRLCVTSTPSWSISTRRQRSWRRRFRPTSRGWGYELADTQHWGLR